MPEIRKCELPGKGYPGEGVKEAGGKALARRTGSGWRRHGGTSGQKEATSGICTERGEVDPTRISVSGVRLGSCHFLSGLFIVPLRVQIDRADGCPVVCTALARVPDISPSPLHRGHDVSLGRMILTPVTLGRNDDANRRGESSRKDRRGAEDGPVVREASPRS